MNEIDYWLAFRADVAKLMLPVIYKSLEGSNNKNQLRSSNDIAIDDTIDIAIALAERLERRLKGGVKR